MSSDPDTTRIVRSWLDEGVTQLPDRVLDAVLDQVPATPQRRATWWPARRTATMNKFLGFGLAAAAAVIVVLFVGIQVFGSAPGGTGSGSSRTPEASVSEPSATPEPSVAEPTSTPVSGLPEGPFQLVGEGYADEAPRITVTIPAPGWNQPNGGVLVKGDEVANVPEAGIITFSEPAGTDFYVYGDPCRWPSTTPETPVATAEDIAAALAAQASRDASEPVDVTVGGYAGKVITLHVPDDVDIDSCERGEFASFGTRSDDLARYHQGPGQIDELWIIDVDGSIVIIDLMYRADTSAELIDELRSIAESATFELP